LVSFTTVQSGATPHNHGATFQGSGKGETRGEGWPPRLFFMPAGDACPGVVEKAGKISGKLLLHAEIACLRLHSAPAAGENPGLRAASATAGEVQPLAPDWVDISRALAGSACVRARPQRARAEGMIGVGVDGVVVVVGRLG